ncbi:TlpA disulfide reductase family protein [Fodinibius sp.]|uniref:TlpA family protein disulfide reductase n=1 Tax=Fodinibius sp. TaxID=1872440 RepID=UPI002ACD5C36|nr:TlpA disulfide reductase family protein [Fodinibius sp.]MDZ7658304.1 TlpA disulfide reductase family protein [Fodinibius sp.]
MAENKNDKQSGWKRSLIEWGVIFAIGAILYMTGLHTEVLGTLQRGMLWTGFFDADTSEIATTDGPMLSDSDYRFAMETADGKTISLSDFRGDVVFVNVWASWCPPCVAEMPTIETLYDNVSVEENIRFILLSMDQERQKATDFMERKEFPMPYYFPASGLPAELRSQYLPTTYIISKKGQIIYKKEGIADYSSPNFAQWIRELAQE